LKVLGSPETLFQKGFWWGPGATPLADKLQFTNPHCHFPQKSHFPAIIVTQACKNVKENAEKIQKPLDNCGKMWYIIR
jgi:hypothetical protein